MLELILGFVFTVLAAIGFAFLLDSAAKRFIRPVGAHRALTVIPLDETSGELELYACFFARYGDGAANRDVIILDCGMSEEQIKAAKLLVSDYDNVFVCNGDDLYSLISALR